jgi:hypothetical protein
LVLAVLVQSLAQTQYFQQLPPLVAAVEAHLVVQGQPQLVVLAAVVMVLEEVLQELLTRDFRVETHLMSAEAAAVAVLALQAEEPVATTVS